MLLRISQISSTKFPRVHFIKQIYCAPFGGCKESYFQLHLSTQHEKFFNPDVECEIAAIWKPRSGGSTEKSLDSFPYD